MEPASSTSQAPSPNQRQNPLANYQFNAEELRVLRECNSESFFQRSLPFGTSLGIAAYYAVKSGYLTPNLKYGAAPKVVIGVIIGYFLGKFSYQRKCMEKIMQLPNSQLADILRKRQKGGMMETITGDGMGMGLNMSPFSPSTADVYSDEHLNENAQTSALNLDTEQNPSFSGLDDIYRPTLDSMSGPRNAEPDLPSEPLNPVKPRSTYEQMRLRNREEFLRKHQTPRPPPKEGDESNTGSSQIKNKYGDTWTG